MGVNRSERIEREDKEKERRAKEERKTPERRASESYREAKKYNENGEFSKAIIWYNTAIYEFPIAVYYNNRGYCHNKLNNVKENLDDYSKALDLDPTNITYRLNRALSYKEIDKLELACSDWKIASNAGSEEAAEYLAKYCNPKIKPEAVKVKTKVEAVKITEKKTNFAHDSLNKNEEWKFIKGYDGKYWLSTRGRVESVWDPSNPKILVTDSNRGWPRADLFRNVGGQREVTRRSVAFLVAEYFLENPYRYNSIEFVDGDFKNVHVDNLIWIRNSYTPSYELTPYIKTYKP